MPKITNKMECDLVVTVDDAAKTYKGGETVDVDEAAAAVFAKKCKLYIDAGLALIEADSEVKAKK